MDTDSLFLLADSGRLAIMDFDEDLAHRLHPLSPPMAGEISAISMLRVDGNSLGIVVAGTTCGAIGLWQIKYVHILR